ncbi:MAG: AbrB/MazE/SpoVT family DNA-binding domain-containing protein [Rhizobiaceae bacterium]|nr:AbrB/MazE/SpoVT family DNA-binding domain-containing protein [Rhizobiaceae bacterium]MCV0406913.1 AbrB/MazE/SpoVT family DNA-binding domain-containing protein [Rhizobiaceae bacterium]
MNAHDPESRKASLFRNGRSQAVRIPKEFEFEGDEVFIRRNKDGDLVLSSQKKSTISPILAWLQENGPIEDFPGDPGDGDMLPLDDVKF